MWTIENFVGKNGKKKSDLKDDQKKKNRDLTYKNEWATGKLIISIIDTTKVTLSQHDTFSWWSFIPEPVRCIGEPLLSPLLKLEYSNTTHYLL